VSVYLHIYTCNRILASRALFGHISLIAVHTVELIFMGRETSSSQWLLARVTHKALRVPWLVLIGDPTTGNGLINKSLEGQRIQNMPVRTTVISGLLI